MEPKEKMSHDQGTMAFAYLEHTEKRIKSELIHDDNRSPGKITAKMIAEKIEMERKKVTEEVSSEPIIETMFNLLNVIEERLKHSLLKN